MLAPDDQRKSAALIIKQSQSEIGRRNYAGAIQLLAQLSPKQQTDESKLLSAEALLGAGDPLAATREIDSVSFYQPVKVRRLRESAVDELWRRGYLHKSTSQLQSLAQENPKQVSYQTALLRSLNEQGRRYESIPILLTLLSSETTESDFLLYLADQESMVEIPVHRISQYMNCPDPGAKLAIACTAIAYNRNEQALNLLLEILKELPTSSEACARLGFLYLEMNDSAKFVGWARNLNADELMHPQVSFKLGQWAFEHFERLESISCFHKTILSSPNHHAAWQYLGNALAFAGLEQQSAICLERASLLETVVSTNHAIYRAGLNPERALTIAEALTSLKRFKEARRWLLAAASSASPTETARLRAAIERLPTSADSDPGWDSAALLSSLNLDWNNYRWPSFPGAHDSLQNDSLQSRSLIAFSDQAEKTGLIFNFFNGDDPSTDGRRMFEYTGGGIGIIDFDRNGLQDVYFCQGSDGPADTPLGEHLDCLFRQAKPGFYENVAKAAAVCEDDFSQAVAIGDLNQDGWPDIYVGTLGFNHLWMNNGDGTFRKNPQFEGPRSRYWTMSAAIADLNQDSLPEIFDINYLTGVDVFNRVCEEDGRPRSCAPTAFPAAPDVVWNNKGDGTFLDQSEEWGIDGENGTGLGITIADFDYSGKLSVFVANDGVANHFYVRNTESRTGSKMFHEHALASGLAFDRNGKPQACMGVAVDDVNGDESLDLFVTNFYDESNTLYAQHSGLFFVDDTVSTGLRAPSIPLLGFGCQFFDIENDGDPDLIITNGHVDDLTYKDVPYRMRTQLFINDGTGRFAEHIPNENDSWFGRELLGRSVALVDWNNDGLEDVVVGFLDAPAALLTNVTKNSGNWLSLMLVGTVGERDAVGASVTVSTKNAKRIRHVTAGSGYAASNSKELTFGLGEFNDPAKLTVRWPSGAVTEIRDVQINNRYVLIEGESSLKRQSSALNTQ